MADSRTTKIVEYQLQGNTVDLEKKLNAAIRTLDTLDRKLTRVSAASPTGRVRQSFNRASTISSTQSQLELLRDTLSSGNITGVSPDQLNLLNQLSIELEKASTNLGEFQSAGSVTNKTLLQTEKTLRQSNTAIKNSGVAAEKAANGFKVLGKAITSVFIIRRLIGYLITGYKESIKLVETFNLFYVAAGDSADALSDFAKAAADAFNTDVGPILNAVAIFRQYATTLGLASEQADILGENLTKLGIDLASLFNTSNEEMFNALRSGLAGLTKPLARYGISVHKATLEQTALRLGVNKTWSEFSEAEKVALRYIAILEQTSNAQGDLARTLESPENQLKIAKAQLQIFIRNLGSLVTIVVQYVLPIFNGLFIAINKFVEALSTAAGYEIPDYSDNLSENNTALLEGAEDAEEYAEAIKGVLAPLDEINQITPKSENDFGVIDQNILDALKGYDNLMDKITTKTDKLAEIFGKIFNVKIFEGVGKILKVLFDVFEKGLNVVINLLNIFSPAINGVLVALGYILQGVGWLLDKIVGPLLSFIDTLTSNIWLLIGAFVALNLAQLAVTGEFKSMIAVKIVQWFVTLASKIWANVTALIANAAATLKARLASIATAVALWWETAAWWQKAIAVIASAGALALVVSGIVIAATSSAKSQADSTINSNTIPQMATGGVVSSPTVALIGEGSYKEAVIPLGNSPQFKTMKEDIASEVLRNLTQPLLTSDQLGRGSGQPVILQINGRELARAILPDLNVTQPQTGVRIQR